MRIAIATFDREITTHTLGRILPRPPQAACIISSSPRPQHSSESHCEFVPWGGDYHYENPGTHGKEYDLYTLGADDQPGGEGANADIGNWNISD